MSFLSSISGIKLNNDVLISLKIPNIFGNLLSAFQQMFNSMSVAVRNFTMIENMDVFLKVKENWNFEVDHVTGVSYLKVEHDDSAISKTRNVLHYLFE